MEDIRDFILMSLNQNEKYCNLNDCSPTEYMQGSNRAYKNVLDYVEGKIRCSKEKREHSYSPDFNNICLVCGKSLEEHNRTGIIHTYYDTSLMNNPKFAEEWIKNKE